jgi:hypothetical protein
MRRLALLTLLVFCVSLQAAYAQSPSATGNQTTAQPSAQGNWLSVTVVTVKPEMMAEFQKYMTTVTNPALRKGGQKWRDVWQQTNNAGNPNEFNIVSPVDNMAQFDGQGALEKALGADGFAEWQNKASSFVTSVHRYIIRTRPDLSYETKMTGPPKLAVITKVSVAPGRNQDYENWALNEYLPMVKRSKVTAYWVSETLFGGDGTEYVALSLRDKFAEIDHGPLAVQVLGAEGARQLNQKMPAGTVVHIDRSFIRYVPELSFRPTETANK